VRLKRLHSSWPGEPADPGQDLRTGCLWYAEIAHPLAVVVDIEVPSRLGDEHAEFDLHAVLANRGRLSGLNVSMTEVVLPRQDKVLRLASQAMPLAFSYASAASGENTSM
jgi:hypothetical protein